MHSPMFIDGKEIVINIESSAYFDVGLSQYNKRDFVGAIQSFSEAIKLEPENNMLYVARGNAYEDINIISAAENDFLIAMRLSNINYLASFQLGVIYIGKGDFETARKWLEISYKNINHKTNVIELEKILGRGIFFLQVKN